jgi:hypothetical protein
VVDIVLVRADTAPISEADREAARRVLFGQVDGLSEQHRKSWRRMWAWFLNKAEPGEMLELKTHRERLGWYHRKHMLMEARVFNAQERFTVVEQFRNWLKVGAGHCDWCPGPKGGVIPVPRSIEYARMGQDEMEIFHANVVEFLRTPHAIKTLWPKMPEHQRELAVEAVLTGLNE